MKRKHWFRVLLLLLQCSTVWAQDVLEKPITKTTSELTCLQIVDSIETRYQLLFSYDASLLTDTLTTAHTDSLTTIGEWLNKSFKTDSSEWILMENQIIIRRKTEVKKLENWIKINGTIIQEDKNEPIPFATISISNTNLATVANIDGEFELTVGNKQDSIEINISSLGFIPTTIKVATITLPFTIKLLERITQLPEVTVSRLNPNTILNRVIEARKVNYPNSPSLLSGFFREAILEEERYIEVTEAAISMYKPSYSNENVSERVMVEKVRRYKDSLHLTMVNLRLEGGPFYFSKLDVVRYGDFLPYKNNTILYKYYFEGTDTEFGKDVYIISFKPIIDSGDLLYTGTIYVDAESFAIVSINFQLSEGAIKKSKAFFVQSEEGGTKTFPLSAKYIVNYRPFKGQWILSYVRGELKLKISNKKRHLNSTFTAITELAITESNLAKYQIIKNGYIKQNEFLSDKVLKNSPLFWKDFNVLPPLQEMRILYNEK